MTLEPNNIEAGYLKRWVLAAFSMLGKNFHLWFALMVALSSIAAILGSNVATGLLLFVGSFVTVNLSLEFALTAEHGRVRLSQVPGMIRRACGGTYEVLSRQRLMLAIIASLSVVFFVIKAVQPTPLEASIPLSQQDILFWLFSAKSPLLNASVMLFIGFQGSRGSAVLRYLVYPLRRMHGVSFEAAEALLDNAVSKNRVPLLVLELMVFLGSGCTFLMFPGLAPLLMCILPAIAYIACRELFGPGAPPVPVRKTVEAANVAPSTT